MDAASTTLAPVSDLIAEYEGRKGQPEPPESEVSKEMFLQLLVAQIRNQNPLNPADGIEFLTQLAQFSELEQLIAIRDEVAGMRAGLEPEEGSGDSDTDADATAPVAGDDTTSE